MLSLGLGRVGNAIGVILCLRPQELRPRASRRCSETPLCEASDEVEIRAGLLTRLAGGPTRGDLARKSSFVDFFP
jgi:hypothetical protein